MTTDPGGSPMYERLLSQLAHVEVLTPTPDESLRFYTDVLGLEVADRAGDYNPALLAAVAETRPAHPRQGFAAAR